METFTKDWKESQQELLQTLKEQEERMVDLQSKKQEEFFDKNINAMEKILQKDREETAKMLQGFLNAMQPTSSYMFQPRPSVYMDPSSSNTIPVPKASPPDSYGAFH